jgi:hypothetical protein
MICAVDFLSEYSRGKKDGITENSMLVPEAGIKAVQSNAFFKKHT